MRIVRLVGVAAVLCAICVAPCFAANADSPRTALTLSTLESNEDAMLIANGLELTVDPRIEALRSLEKTLEFNAGVPCPCCPEPTPQFRVDVRRTEFGPCCIPCAVPQ